MVWGISREKWWQRSLSRIPTTYGGYDGEGGEQQRIEANGGAKSQGGTSGNAINDVSARNPKASVYKREAEKEFGNVYGETTKAHTR